MVIWSLFRCERAEEEEGRKHFYDLGSCDRTARKIVEIVVALSVGASGNAGPFSNATQKLTQHFHNKIVKLSSQRGNLAQKVPLSAAGQQTLHVFLVLAERREKWT